MKKYIFALIVFSASVSFAEEATPQFIPLAQCDETNFNKCEVVPSFNEVDLGETIIFTPAWGTISLVSKPVLNGMGVKNIIYSLYLKCSGQKKKLLKKDTICSYRKFNVEKNLESQLFVLNADPKLNFLLSEKDKTLTVLFRDSSGNDGENCDIEKSITLRARCP